MLKQRDSIGDWLHSRSAAFGRLRVETGWIKRQSVGILQIWAESLQELEFTDISGKAHKVMFDNSSDESVSFQPVSGFTDGLSGEWYYGSVKLFEIGN